MILFPNEIAILNSLDSKYKYITRDSTGDLYIYSKRPFKLKGTKIWDCEDGRATPFVMYNHLFSHINYTDKEPRKIKELINRYEYVR